MKFCHNCGFEIEEQTRFCPSCGVRVESIKASPLQAPFEQSSSYQRNDSFQSSPTQRNDSFQSEPIQRSDSFQSAPIQRNDSFQNAPGQQQNPYRPFQQPYQQQRISRTEHEKHIIFIFVTSMIFMIIFAIKCLVSLASISELQYNKGYYQNTYIAGALNIFITFIAFAAVLIFFIFAANSKNKNHDIQKRVRSSEVLYTFSVTSLLLGIVYLMSNIYFIAVSRSALDVASKIVFLILIDIPFIVFSIINTIKSQYFKMDIRRKFQKAEDKRYEA